MAPPPPATCGPQPSGHPRATDNSRSFLRADSRGSSLSGTHSSQAAAARSAPRLGVLGPPLSSVLGSGPQHWVCCARPGDPRPRSAATALALGSGRRGPSASILSPIPPHSAPSSPGDKGASARRRPSATRCLYSRQGCEGTEGRGHMTGTPAPPAARSPPVLLLSPYLPPPVSSALPPKPALPASVGRRRAGEARWAGVGRSLPRVGPG